MRKILLATTLLPSVAFSASQYDGVYKGSTVTTITNNSSICQNSARPTAIHIVDSHFTKPWEFIIFNVTVQPDGSFSDSETAPTGGRGQKSGGAIIRRVTMSGRIVGNSLEADIVNPVSCSFHLSLKKEG